MNTYNKKLYKNTSVICFKTADVLSSKHCEIIKWLNILHELLLNGARLFINKFEQGGILNCFKFTLFHFNFLFQNSISPNRRAFCLLMYTCKRQLFQMENGERISSSRKRNYLAMILMQILVLGFSSKQNFCQLLQCC